MREWLIVLVVILIAGILLHGVHRARLMRGQKIRLSKQAVAQDALLGQLPESDETQSDFPSGGARVAALREDADRLSILQNLKNKHAQSRKTRSLRETDSPSLEESAPAITPPQDKLPNLMKAFAKRTQEPQLTLDLDNNPLDTWATPDTPPAPPTAAPAAPRPSGRGDTKNITPQEVIVMTLIAPAGEVVYGNELMPVLMDLQLRFGDMDIFHRHAQANGTGDILFSLANLVKPGTFCLADMPHFETPGFTLFLTLPAGEDSMEAFALMAQAAKRLAKEFNLDLKDDTRSAMTAQTFEHYKERVAEFERKRRLAKV